MAIAAWSARTDARAIASTSKASTDREYSVSTPRAWSCITSPNDSTDRIGVCSSISAA